MSLMSTSIVKIAPALLLAQKEMGDAAKSAKNPFFKSFFADLNSVREAVMPALNKHGVTVLQLTTPGPEGRQFLRTLLLHESGEFLGSDTEIVCAKQNDPQALGSAMSYARRYGLQAMLCVGAVDDDGNVASGKVNTAPPPAKPAATVAAVKKTEAVVTPTIVAAPVQEVVVGKFPRPKKVETKPEGGDLF